MFQQTFCVIGGIQFYNKFFSFLKIPLSNFTQINHLRTNPEKRSNTLNQFVGNSQRTVWLCLIILWGSHLMS